MKKEIAFDKYCKVLDVNALIKNSFLNTEFKNENLEEDYQNFLIKSYRNVKIIEHSILLFLLFFRVFFSKKKESYETFFIIDLSTSICVFILVLITHLLIKRPLLVKNFNYLISVFVTLVNCYSAIIIQFYFISNINGVQIREAYVMIIITLFELVFTYEINFIIFLFYYLIVVTTLLTITFIELFIDKERYKEIVIFTLVAFSFYIFKKDKSYILRQNFLNNYKLNKLFSYCNDLINNMNGQHFVIKNKKIEIYNENFKKFINDSKYLNKIHNLRSLDSNNEIKNDNNVNNNKEIPEKGILNLNKELYHKNFDEYQTMNNKNKNFERSKTDDSIKINNLIKTHNHNILIKTPTIKNTEARSFINEEYILRFNENIALDNDCIKHSNDLVNNLHKNRKTGFFSKICIFFKNLFDCKKKIGINYNKVVEISNQDCIDSQGKIYLEKLKTKILHKEFENYKSDNLLEILEKLRLNFKAENENFNLLGFFVLEVENKYLQVYFRKHFDFNDLIDFLIYDLTQLKEAEELEFNLKSKFFAKIAHEFKTPLNSIIGLIKNFNTESKNRLNYKKEYKKTFNQIENLSNYVIFLINDIIDYSKMISTKHHNVLGDSINEDKVNLNNINLSVNMVNLKEITNFCSEITLTLLKNKGKEKTIKVENIFDEKIQKLKLFSDDFRLRQILLNFLSNSVKFTRSGFIKIISEIIEPNPIDLNKYQLSFEKKIDKNILDKRNPSLNSNDVIVEKKIINNEKEIRDNIALSQNYLVRISVIDSGIGIKEDELKNLLKFNDNFMISSSKNINQEGSGLGLSITKFLIEKLDHHIQAESIYGKGTTFSVLIKPQKSKSNKELEHKFYLELPFEDDKEIVKFKAMTPSNKNKLLEKESFFSSNNNLSNTNQLSYDKNFKKPLLLNNNYLNSYMKNKLSKKYLIYYNNGKLGNKSYGGKEDFRKQNELSVDYDNNKKLSVYEKHSNSDFEKKKGNQLMIYDFENDSVSNDNKTKKLEDKEINFLLNDSTIKSRGFKRNNKMTRSFYTRNRLNLKKKLEYYFKNDFPGEISSDFSIISKTSKFGNNKLNINIINNEYNKYSQNFNMNKSSSCFSSKFKKASSSKNCKDENHSSDIDNISCINFKHKKEEDRRIILIVDDHKFIRESLKKLIKNILVKKGLTKHFTVKEAIDGSYLISLVINDQFNENKISCVITDENMEFINGSEAIKIIRELEKDKKIKPIIIASSTAFEDEITKKNINDVGVNYFLPKPCSESNLLKFFEEYKIFEYENNLPNKINFQII